jgi:hypothetical protein
MVDLRFVRFEVLLFSATYVDPLPRKHHQDGTGLVVDDSCSHLGRSETAKYPLHIEVMVVIERPL